jgi:DNA-binding LacI/PurR family transcriptional regulator
LGALLAFQESGRRCPEDVALIGFDDHPWAPVTSPPLTSVRQPDYEIGRRAADLLLRMLAGEPVGDEHVLLRPELIVRASCRVGAH